MTNRMALAAAVLTASALVLAGCGTEGTTVPPSPTTSASASETPSASTSPSAVEPSPTPSPSVSDAPSAQLPPFQTGDQGNVDQAQGRGFTMSAVRAATHDGYDRYVIEFSAGEGQLAWETKWVDEATTAGKGEAITLPGDAMLAVRLPNMWSADAIPAVILRGQQATVGGAITASYVDPPFEAQGQVFIGVTSERPYRVFELAGPTRLVIDFEQA